MREYSFFLVIDLEATCCDQRSIRRDQTEIIEIGAVMVAEDTLDVVDEFESFVRPVRHPQLTAFCTDLTSITQQQVDGAPLLAEVLANCLEWANRYLGFLFCSWGDYDRNQLKHECRINGIPYPFGDEHLNLKQRFTDRQQLRKRYGMAAALNLAGLKLDGTHHRGIDDARNIARLLPFIVGSKKIP